MKTEVRLGEALKKLMSKESLDTITVKRLSELCKINRQTFYYHFRDIYDLLTWVYLNESIKELEIARDFKDALQVAFDYIKKNTSFVKGTLDSAGHDLFFDFIYSAIYRFEMNFASRLDAKSQLSSEEKRFVAAYFASSATSMIVKWAESDMKEDSGLIINRLSSLQRVASIDLISEMIKNRGGSIE